MFVTRSVAMTREVGEAFLLQIASVALLFLMHAVLANLMGAAQYGILNYALLAAGLLAFVTTLGLPNGVMRFAAEYQESRDWPALKGVVSASGWLVMSSSVTVGASLAAIAHWWVDDDALRPSLIYAGIVLPFIALGMWRSRAMRGLHRLREALLPEDVLRPALVIAFTVLVFFGVGEIGAEQAVIVFTLVAAAALALGLWWLRRHMPAPARSAPSRYRLRVWLITSLPMCGASLLQEVLNRCDALLLGWWSGVEQAGVYSAAARVALLSVLLLKVVDTVVAPQIASAYFGARTGELRATFRRAMLLSGAGALPLFLIMFMWPERIMSMFGEEFVAAATLLQILAVGQFVNAVTGPVGNALLMTGHEKQYFNVMLFCAAANVLGNLVAIPVWGMAGAAVVTASNVALMNLLLLLRVRRIHFAKSGHAAHG